MSISKFGKIVNLDMLMSELAQIMGVKVGKSLKLDSFEKRKEKIMKKITYSWGRGYTDLFLSLDGKTPKILDVESDHNKLHEMCGGRTTFVSRSGNSGEGFFDQLGSLIPVGLWRVDTRHNHDYQFFSSVGKIIDKYVEEDVLVAIPYVSHEEDKKKTLTKNPVVIKVGRTVIYCDFYTNFTQTLKAVLLGGDLPEFKGRRKVKKTFQKTFTHVDKDDWDRDFLEEENFEIDFYNLSQNKETPNPWSFFRSELVKYQIFYRQPRIFELLGVEQLPDGKFVSAINIDGTKYCGKTLDGNPLETGELTAGWQRITEDVLIRFYDNEAHLMAYASAKELYAKKAYRLANKMNQGEEFIEFLKSAHQEEYEEFELLVPKALYMLDGTNLIAKIRKDLANKIKENFHRTIWNLIGQVTDEKLLESIPDNLVIYADDYRRINNWFSDIEDLVNKYFSAGQTEVAAKNLKEYAADNWDVMRVFRYLAAEGRFKINLPLED